jgi:hypothetical protein
VAGHHMIDAEVRRLGLPHAVGVILVAAAMRK